MRVANGSDPADAGTGGWRPVGLLMMLGPRTMLGQLIAIIVLALSVTLLVTLGLLFILRPLLPAPPSWPWSVAASIATLTRTLSAAPPELREALAASVERPDLRARLGVPVFLCEGDSPWAQELRSALDSMERGRFLVRYCPSSPVVGDVQVLTTVGDKALEVRTDQLGQPKLFMASAPFAFALLFLFCAVLVLAIWSIARIVRPLRRLSATAERFGQDLSLAVLPEEGPSEMRQAARAFNAMQERIVRSVEDRTRMLAAISHDLRTPLTRMLLRLEMEGSGELLEKLGGDIHQMQKMVSSSLSYLSGGQKQVHRARVRLDTLLSTIRDDYADLGHRIEFACEAGVIVLCDADTMRRAVTNLVDNACRYGERVRMELRTAGEWAIIDVADDGPGIPVEQRQAALTAYTRLETGQPDREGHVGLGLFIVQTIVASHRGRLSLLDSPSGGLLVRIAVPRMT